MERRREEQREGGGGSIITTLIKCRIRSTYARNFQNNGKKQEEYPGRFIRLRFDFARANIPRKNIATLNPQTIIATCRTQYMHILRRICIKCRRVE